VDVNRLPAPNFGASEWQPACAIQMAEPDAPACLSTADERFTVTTVPCLHVLSLPSGRTCSDKSLVGRCDFHRFSPMHILGIVPPEAMLIGLML
jgi:hypothetical protein